MNRKDFLTTLGTSALAMTATSMAATNSTSGPAPADTPVAAGTPPSGGALDTLLNLDEIEAAAQAKLPPAVYSFLAGGSADELTVRWNREKYRDLRLEQRILRDLSGLDCSTTLLGKKMPMPLLLAPTSGHKLSHPEGEIATVRGANETGVTMVLSSGSTTSIEDVKAAASVPLWFQLYVFKDRALSRTLVDRVQAAGAEALCVTVDSPLDGPRNRQYHLPASLPAGASYPHYVGIREPGSVQNLEKVVPANLLWKDIEWLRSASRVPLLLKGVMSPADAEMGIKLGADGIIVSNHGGRCLDTQPATIEALPRIVDAVAGRVPVIVDGGIRRGTDIVKALALGASAVQIGRPYVYGLAVGGSAGVAHVIKILRQELLMAMSLLGRPTVASIDRSVIWR